MPIATTNPATGETMETFEPYTDEAVDAAIGRSLDAHHALRRLPMAERAALMERTAAITEDRAEDLACTMTLEMGKPIGQARAEVAKCAAACRHYAEHAAGYLADDEVPTEHARAFRRYRPLGPILAVMPWNFPLWQVYRFAVPALMAGNTCLLKHASNVPRCALGMQAVFEAAGWPKGSFEALLIPSGAVEGILRDERVRGATLTGSEPAGAAVAAVCGELIKPVVLELGGSDAFLVRPSADLDEAVRIGLRSRMQNNGQSCIAAKRFVVDDVVYDAFRDRFVAAVRALRVGDPSDEATEIGPMVDRAARDEVVRQVEAAVADGATLLTGGHAVAGPDGREASAYLSPGVLEGVRAGTPAYTEEVFGPVATLYRVSGMDEALAVANASPFGLGGAIFTTDPAEAERAADELEAGATFVNAMTASDPRLPFGGIKRSGVGRELSAEGIRAFCNLKTVVVA